MKVRIGIGLGGSGTPGAFADALDMLEDMGADSLWLPEMVYGPLVEPIVGMAHALARTRRLKVGTGISVLPGRNPVLVAKQLASLAGLAPGRVLPVFGLQSARPAERPLFPVPAGRRATVFDESLALLRMLLQQEAVSFAGEFFTVDGAGVGPLPAKPLDIWVGGSAPAALRRAGRLADGWLGSLLTPDEARAGRETIQAAAAEAGREVEDDHFGISLAVATGPVPGELTASVRHRRPDTDPTRLIPAGWDAARRMIGEYVDAGLSKFVIRPATVPPGPDGPPTGAAGLAEFLDGFASELMPLQT